MKRIILLFIIFLVLIFIIPTLFSQKVVQSSAKAEIKEAEALESEDNQQKSEEESGTDEINKENYDYKEYTTIKLLHKNDNSVQELPLDEYLLGVVSGEMPATFEQEALNAQAIVARTYTIYMIKNGRKHEEADICDSASCCQAWITKEDRLARWDENVREENWKKIEKAVYSTKGKIITYNGEVIDAFFHSNSGGMTETPAGVWGGTNYPYLQSVATAGEDAYDQYSSEVVLTKEDFKKKILESHSDFSIDFSQENCIQITEYTDSNRVKTVKVGNLNLSGVEMRTLLGLRSTNFTFTVEGDNIKFEVIGYGHGVGMSQTGADSMAKQGSNCEEIIKHFYTGVEIVNM